MANPNPFDLNKLFEGSLRRLRAEAEYFSHLTNHASELGRLNETHLVQMLQAYLPPKIGIGTGFIASGGISQNQSPQCDIILFDKLNNFPLYKSETWSIYPIEMVYGVIEVKTNLNNRQLNDAFKKCAKIRGMTKTPDGHSNKAYMVNDHVIPGKPVQYRYYTTDLPPRFFVFSYSGWKTKKGLDNNFRILSDKNKSAHIHGVCNLYDEGSLYIRHIAYEKGENRFSPVTENGFRYFLMNLPATLNSMLPPHRLGLGFDQIPLKHYQLEVR